jgi:hypothetical protein
MTQEQYHRTTISMNKWKIASVLLTGMAICVTVVIEGGKIVAQFSSHEVKIENLDKRTTRLENDVDLLMFRNNNNKTASKN